MLNTGLTWQLLDFSTVITVNTQYVAIVDIWPSNVLKCGNLVQLNITLDILNSTNGNGFIQINDPCKPAVNTYICFDGGSGVVLRPNGSCDGWLTPGRIYIHAVYAI